MLCCPLPSPPVLFLLSTTFITLCPLETQRTNLISVFYDSQLFNYSFTHSADLYWVTAICRHWEPKVENTKPCFQECPSLWHLILPFAVSALQGNSSCVPMLGFLATPLFWMSWSKIFKVGAWVGISQKWFYRNFLTRAKGVISLPQGALMRWCNQSHHHITRDSNVFLFSIYWIKSKITILPPGSCPT